MYPDLSTPTTIRSRARRLLAGTAITALAAGGLTTLVLTGATAASATSSVGGQITRSEVISRVDYWKDVVQPPYNEGTPYYPDPEGRKYRPDCSGSVSMAWHLDDSYNTWNLNPESHNGGSPFLHLTHEIDFSSLQPGDALVADNSDMDHMALFDHWADPNSKTRPVVDEEYDYGHTEEQRTWDASYAQEFVPIRYNKIEDDPAPVVDGGGQVADLNGDGRADLVTMAGNGDLSDWEGTGDIAHPYVSSLRYSIGTGFNAFHVLLAGDLNADHKADLVTMTGNGDLYAWQGTGDIKHPFLASLKYAIGTGFNGFTRIALADLNADGKADLITMTSNGNLYAWQNTGDIKHPYLASLKYAIGTGFDAYTSLSAADLNADNKADLITMTSNGNLYDWQNTGDIKHPYLAAQKYAIGTGFNTYTRIRAAEINNDHHADLITMTSNGTLTDWQGTGDIKHPYTASLKHTIGTGFDTYPVIS